MKHILRDQIKIDLESLGTGYPRPLQGRRMYKERKISENKHATHEGNYDILFNFIFYLFFFSRFIYIRKSFFFVNH